MTELPPLDSYRGFTAKLPTQPHPPEHLPNRPSWACGVCGAEWPCATARVKMRAEHSRTGIATLMWAYLETYATDFGPGPLQGAFNRFIAWTR